MALFEVPGWSMPSAPVSATSKKRKRKHSSQILDQLRIAEVNLDKLMHSLDSGENTSGAHAPKKKKKRKDNRIHAHPNEAPETISPAKSGRTKNRGISLNKKQRKGSINTIVKVDEAGPSQPRSTASASTHDRSTKLTSLQKGMRESLDGARFRWINELLYKSESSRAVKMVRDDSKVFDDYHVGFRYQVQSWPSNPVSQYISELSTYPPKTVVVDLGCGDADLAKALQPKNLNVISFDLVSDGTFVIAADICSHLPLPGSEPRSAEVSEGEAQIVDVAVCALSLMSTNWPKCIREVWRILRPGGEFKIAEVASRFASVDDFISLVCSLGFKLKKKDDGNSYFTLFHFDKVARAVLSEKDWAGIMSLGSVLKPCEYKRR